jgi:hypothetical protein
MRWTRGAFGDKRIKKGFLFFPKVINNETRWLEFAEWEQKYVVDNAWISTKWIDNKEK